MSIFTQNQAATSTQDAAASQAAKYLKQIDELKADIKKLETDLLKSQVTQDVGFKIAENAKEYAASVQKRNEWLEERNATLENPKGSHYTSLSWPGKIIFCIKKMKRPLRFQEIMQELTIMESLRKTESWLTEKTISVTLCIMAKEKRLHNIKQRGTRGAFYALNEWVNEAGELNEKLRRAMW